MAEAVLSSCTLVLCCCFCWSVSAPKCLSPHWGNPCWYCCLHSASSHHETLVAEISESLKSCCPKGSCVRGLLAKQQALKPVPKNSLLAPLRATAACNNPARAFCSSCSNKAMVSSKPGTGSLPGSWESWLGDEVWPPRPCQGGTSLRVKNHNFPGLCLGVC